MKCDDGRVLRKELKTHLPHIRVCNVSNEDFCRDVVPTGVLSESETIQIFLYHGNKSHKPDLLEICDITRPRSAAQTFEDSEMISFNITAGSYGGYNGQYKEVHFDVITREHEVKLCSLALFCSKSSLRKDVTVEIRQVNCAESPPPISVTALVQDPTYTVDLSASSNSESVILRPNSQYRITLRSSSGLDMYTCSSSSVCNTHFTVNHLMIDEHSSRARAARHVGDALALGTFISCINYIDYKTLTPK